MALFSPIPNWVEVIKDAAANNHELQELVMKVIDGEALGPWQYKEGLLIYKDRIFSHSCDHGANTWRIS